MIINHIVQRREERRQRKARWMLSRCFTQEVLSTSSMPDGMEVQITDIIIEEPLVIPDIIIEEPVVIIVDEPIVIVEKAIIPVKAIDEASEELRKLLILHQTIKTLSSTNN